MLLQNSVIEILEIKNSWLNYIKQRKELAAKYFKVNFKYKSEENYRQFLFP